MKVFAVAAAALTVSAAALMAVPVLFTDASGAAMSGCAGSGSIDGDTVPAGVEMVARAAAQRTGVDELVLLAVTYQETRWGQAAAGVLDDRALAWLGDL